MDSGSQDEIEDLSSLSPPPVGPMHITGNNGFVHNLDLMAAQTYLRNRSSTQIDIQDDASPIKDRPLPIFLKVNFFNTNTYNLL